MEKEIAIPTHRPLRKRIDGLFYGNLKAYLIEAISNKQPLLLKGESGTGKSTIISTLAKNRNVEVIRVDGSGNLTEDEIIGCNTLVPAPNGSGITMKWKDGFLADAVRNGKWIIVEEINGIKPGVRLAFHSILEDDGYLTIPHTGEKIYKHPNFRFFATMNPPSVQYAGTQRDNFAFSDRFISLSISYLDVDSERELILKYFGYNKSYPHYDKIKEVVTYLCEFAASQRSSFSNGEGVGIPITTRKLIHIVQYSHLHPISSTVLQLMRGLLDFASAKAVVDSLTVLIPKNSELDRSFRDLGKTPPTKDFATSLGELKAGKHEAPIKGSTPSETIDLLGESVNYFNLAHHYTYKTVYDDQKVSYFDARYIEVARAFMEQFNFYKDPEE